MADKEKGNNPLQESLTSVSQPANFSEKKSHRALVFSKAVINNMIARTVSLKHR
jgi:hypothetical protein